MNDKCRCAGSTCQIFFSVAAIFIYPLYLVIFGIQSTPLEWGLQADSLVRSEKSCSQWDRSPNASIFSWNGMLVTDAFDISTLFIRRSQTMFGNLARFTRIQLKLQEQKCLKILILGGSITDTMNIRKQNEDALAWWEVFQRALDEVYPCPGGHHFYKGFSQGTASDWFLVNYWDIARDKNITYDIVFAEWSINDFETEREDVPKRTEYVIRTLGSQPGYAPLVWYVEVTFSSWYRRKKPPCLETAQSLHEPVLKYYQLPMTSIGDALFSTWTNNASISRFERCEHKPEAWFPDGIHPTPITHSLTAYLLLEHLKEMGRLYEEEFWEGRVPSEFDWPFPWMIDMQSLHMYIARPVEKIDFQKPRKGSPEFHEIVRNETWYFIPETDKKKWGLISYDSDNKLSIRLQSFDYVSIGFLATYENIGNAFVWISDSSDMPDCGTRRLLKKKKVELIADILTVQKGENVELVALHSQRASQPAFKHLKVNHTDAVRQDLFLHFCTVKSDKGRKFKLLSVTTKIITTKH